MAKKRRFAATFAAIAIPFIQPALAAEVFFSPGPDCERRIIEEVNNSKTEIVAAVYSLSNPRIVEALINAHKRKVNVRLLTDRVQAAGKSSALFPLLEAGVNIRVHSKHKIEHNKFLVVDKRVAETGSFNFTRPASEQNSENCVFFDQREANVITAFRERFDTLWNLNTAEKSNAYVAKQRAKREGVSLSAKPIAVEQEASE